MTKQQSYSVNPVWSDFLKSTNVVKLIQPCNLLLSYFVEKKLFDMKAQYMLINNKMY